MQKTNQKDGKKLFHISFSYEIIYEIIIIDSVILYFHSCGFRFTESIIEKGINRGAADVCRPAAVTFAL